MPRPTNFVAFIRNIVREQVHGAIQGLLGGTARPRKKATNGCRRRRRRRGPGSEPGSKTRVRRRPRRLAKTEQVAPSMGTRRRRRRPGGPAKQPTGYERFEA